MKHCYHFNLFVLSFLRIIKPSRVLLSALLLLSLGVQAQTYWGSGSRDLYKATSLGNRALLMSRGASVQAYDPFPNDGRMMVYARVGEQIHVASSVQGRSRGGNNATIRLRAPNGTIYTSGTTAIASGSSGIGKILNRTQEVAGPTTSFHVGGYTPYTVSVGIGEEGIWTIEFVSTGIGSQQADIAFSANANWLETNQETISTTGVDGSGFIIAWDASVSGKKDNNNDLEFKAGRLFTTVFNGSISGAGDGFYGKFYALTKDGFTYSINNNGQNGLSFNFFVNNKGVYNPINQVPIYKSSNGSSDANTKIWDPRKLDEGTNITHKMFYTTPDINMPDSTIIWNGELGRIDTTWLKNVRGNPNLDPGDIKFFGFEGEEGISGPKGGYVRFPSTVNGKYKITIPFGPGRPAKVLTGNCVMGINNVLWDGTDGDNVRVNTTTTIAGISARLEGAEVHFPLIDVENNPNGVIIELLDNDYSSLSPKMDIVYWDNAALPGLLPPSVMINLNGSSSTTAGHKWGVNNANGTNNFGDSKVVDTWSFAPGAEATYNGLSITVLETDLRVDAVTKTVGPNTVSVGDQLIYQVPIFNAGPSGTRPGKPATFFFYVPKGITINYNAVTFNSTTGVVTHNGLTTPPVTINSSSAEVNVYKVEVNMPAGSGGTFTIPVTVTSGVPTRHVNAWGTIMRSDDITDPNASFNNNQIQKPIDPFQEANGIHKLVTVLNLNADITTNTDFADLRGSIAGTVLPASLLYTNNIKYNNDVQMYADVQIQKTAVKSPPIAGTSTATFTLAVKNNGISVANNVVISDVLNAAYTYTNHSVSKGNANIAAGTSTWIIASLLPGETAQMTINATFTTGSPPNNTATITANEFDPLTSNNTSTVSLPVTTTPIVDLKLTKTVDDRAPAIGGVVNFTITLERLSGVDVTDVMVNDLLPSGYLYKGHLTSQGTYNASTGLWSVGIVNSAAPKTLTIEAFVKAPSSAGEYLNVATIAGITGATDTDLGNNTSNAVVVPTIVDLAITKTVNNATPNVGAQVTFKLTVTNSGPSDAAGVVVYDKLPNGYTYVSDNGGGAYNPTSGLWTIDKLNNGSTVSLDVVVTVNQTGQYLNTALVSTTSPESNYNNNAAKALVTPNCTVRNISPKVN